MSCHDLILQHSTRYPVTAGISHSSSSHRQNTQHSRCVDTQTTSEQHLGVSYCDAVTATIWKTIYHTQHCLARITSLTIPSTTQITGDRVTYTSEYLCRPISNLRKPRDPLVPHLCYRSRVAAFRSCRTRTVEAELSRSHHRLMFTM